MVLELLVRLPRAWNLCVVYAHVSVCVLMCMCVKWPPLSLAILCVNKGLSLSESWAHQLASLTGHPSVVIHCLCVLTTVVCALPCLSFYLRTSNPNSGAQTCTVSTLPTISLLSTTKTMKKLWRCWAVWRETLCTGALLLGSFWFLPHTCPKHWWETTVTSSTVGGHTGQSVPAAVTLTRKSLYDASDDELWSHVVQTHIHTVLCCPPWLKSRLTILHSPRHTV